MADDISAENSDLEPRYVFLDFNGKLTNDIIQNKVFLRIANLHKKNPLVQVNDSVFKGTYDHSMGTNLFFEEIEDPPLPGNAFEKQTQIHLNHILSCTKVINLKQVKIPQRKAVIKNEAQKIEFNVDWDYNRLLENFEKGTLEIQDIVKNDTQSANIEKELVLDENVVPTDEQEDVVVIEEPQVDTDIPEENRLDAVVPVKILEAEYKTLNMLARRPVKRAVSPELVAECDLMYREAYEYHNIECQILQTSSAFRAEKITNIDEADLSNCVDLDRCVLYGIIPPSTDFPRILSQREKRKILTLENFENLSLVARYYVLNSHVNDLKKYVESLSDKLDEIDEYGHSPMKTFEIYTKLCQSVKNRICDIKYSLDN